MILKWAAKIQKNPVCSISLEKNSSESANPATGLQKYELLSVKP